ncbi:hypothetical protein F4779DRAFT_578464 [Xylariaceae sp. FL0662B]|nr:hypothetical protein F4779DRAFT_578464 [Xylariaceae sp. FL0662B]
MTEVYGDSYVTISATTSTNSASRFFHRHDPHSVKHSIKLRVEGGQLLTINVRPSLEHTPYFASHQYGLDESALGGPLGMFVPAIM